VGTKRLIPAAKPAPTWTVGPCLPKVKPEPKEITALINLTKATLHDNVIGTLAKAALTWGIPLPEASGANLCTNQPERKPKLIPITGRAINGGNMWLVCTLHVPNHPEPCLSNTADKAATIPIIEASAIAKPFLGCQKFRKYCVSNAREIIDFKFKF
jgi:hypothetical protein